MYERVIDYVKLSVECGNVIWNLLICYECI